MANSRTRAHAAQITREDLRVRRSGFDEYAVIYRGTADELMEAGVVELRHLPRLGNDRRKQATFTAGGVLVRGKGRRDGPGAWIVQIMADGRYNVIIWARGWLAKPDFDKFMEKTLGVFAESEAA